MQKWVLLAGFAGIAMLAACGPSLSSDQKAQREYNQARTAAAMKTATTHEVNGKSFRVAVIEDRTYALVDLVSKPVPYTAVDVEAAAKAATGCKAEFSAGVLAFVGGDPRTADLTELRKKISGTFNGWRVDLTC